MHQAGRSFAPLAVLEHGGLLGRQLQQAANGIPRPFQGARLDQLGDGEKHADHGRFRPLADQQGAGDGDAHQCVDIQVAVLQGDPALLVGGQACAEDGQDRQPGDHPLRREIEPFAGFRRQGGEAGQGQRPPGLLHLGRCARRGAFGQRHGLHAQAFDQALQGLQVVEAVAHPQQALHEVEFQGLDGRDLAQGIADQALLGGAVHGLDAQAAPARLGGGGDTREVRRGGTGCVVMVVAAMVAHGSIPV
ncbi:hypothetical protein D3C72_1423620 [compost metagenome]